MAEEKKKRGPGRPPGSKNKSKKNSTSSSDKRSSSKAETAEQKQIREMQEKRNSNRKLIDEIWGIAIFAIGIFLVFTMKNNSTGSFGHGIHNVLRGLFGGMSYVLPYFLIVVAVCLFFQKLQHLNARTASLTALVYLMMCALNGYRFVNSGKPKFGFGDILLYYRGGVRGNNAGAVGMELANILVKFIGRPGLIIFALAAIIISILLVANTPISKQIKAFKEAREEKRLIKEFERSGGTVSPVASQYENISTDTAVSSARPSVNEQMEFGSHDHRMGTKATSPNPASGTSFTSNAHIASVDDSYVGYSPNVQDEEPTSGLFGRMLAKHLNSKKQKSVTDAGIGTVTANPVNAAAGNRTTDVGGSAYSSMDAAYKEKKTATGFPDESTRREIASMLDSNAPFEEDESGIYDGYRGKAARQIGTGLGSSDDGIVTGTGYGLDGKSGEAGTEKTTGLGGYDGAPEDGATPKGRGFGLDGGKPSVKSKVAEYRGRASGGGDSAFISSPGSNYLYGAGASRDFGAGVGVTAAGAIAAANKRSADAIDSSDNMTSSTSSNEALHEQKEDNRPTKADHDEIAKQALAGQSRRDDDYVFPSVDLLNRPKPGNNLMSGQQLEEKAHLLERTLNDFNVEATVLNVTQGASVTRYEVQPATGVKVSKITGLADDIALNMRAKSIRIEAPIPGKAAVGIEVENEKAAPVLIRELIESNDFRCAKSKISFVVGKDVSGRNIVADLHSMPHMLIAGATGSGKSVCINTIITSILYKASPDEVKLVLIDPKVVELGSYNGIPHMLIPVVTDPKKAAAALNWAVNEMQQRYNKFAELGAKDLASYNHTVSTNGEGDNVLPQIVIVIDELADLMMAASSQVEEAICRLAQKARAAGMHLIVATQRPSVDVVTGLIKANIPSRIAFSVSSQFDSRTILDTAGAEKLLGKGDMLFSPVDANKPIRIQGPFISEAESAAVIEFVKSQSETEYRDDVIRTIEVSDKPAAQGDSLSDELTEDAIEFILKQKQASVSMLQRRFRIGYNRAARIIDEIEEMGIIGPSDGSRPRQVLTTEEEYYDQPDQTVFVDESIDAEAVNLYGDEPIEND